MALRYERDGEIVANAVKRNGRNSREANRPTGTEKARTKDTVEGMAVDVETAKEQAQQAIDDAADALTTSSGKNARRRGETEPSPPPGGWAQGDQWIVDNDDGKPVEVRVWDGDEFVFEQLLAAELLVVSGGGIVRLADGVVTADAIAADAIDGMIITGALIRQYAPVPTGMNLALTLPGNLKSWITRGFVVSMADNSEIGPSTAPPSGVDSTSFVYGDRVLESGTYYYVTRVAVPDIIPEDVEFTATAWVCSFRASKTVQVTWPDLTVQNVALTSGVWQQVSRVCTSNDGPLKIMEPLSTFPLATFQVGVADVSFETEQEFVVGSELSILNGEPALTFYSGGSDVSLARVGGVSPSGLELPGVTVSDAGMTVRSGGGVTSGGLALLAGQSVEIIGPDGVSIGSQDSYSPVNLHGDVRVRGGRFGLIASGTFTAQSQFDITGLTGALRYEITLIIPTSSAAQGIGARLMQGASVDTTSNYDISFFQAQGGAPVGAAQYQQSSWQNLLGAGAVEKIVRLTLINLNAAEKTYANADVDGWATSSNAVVKTFANLRHRTVAAFDGVQFITTGGTVTGRYEVRAL